jgi:hypothetical protein
MFKYSSLDGSKTTLTPDKRSSNYNIFYKFAFMHVMQPTIE